MGAILALLLAACSQEVTEPTAVPEIAAASPTTEATDTPEPEPTATETVVPTETASPTETVAPTVAPTDTPEPVQVADECLACHMDKEQLIQTAALVEEVPSESSGVG